MKQVKFIDLENNEIHGGILLDNGDVVCGCCGGLIEGDEIGTGADCTHRILKIFYDWENIDEAICGDTLYEGEA